MDEQQQLLAMCATPPSALPIPTEQPLPDQLRDLINQFAYAATGPVAPPCDEQPRLGNLVGQNGKYFPHVVPAPNLP